MSNEAVQRRLTTILAADVVSFSQLMANDEVGTLAALRLVRQELLNPKTEVYRGRVIKLMGDGNLLEFTSVVSAVSFAADVQRAMQERNETSAESERLVSRIGINVGDVLVEGDDTYGDGVNVASRLEAFAEPGGIYLSQQTHAQVEGKVDLVFEDMGECRLENLPTPVRVSCVGLDGSRSVPGRASGPTVTWLRRRWPTGSERARR